MQKTKITNETSSQPENPGKQTHSDQTGGQTTLSTQLRPSLSRQCGKHFNNKAVWVESRQFDKTTVTWRIGQDLPIRTWNRRDNKYESEQKVTNNDIAQHGALPRQKRLETVQQWAAITTKSMTQARSRTSKTPRTLKEEPTDNNSTSTAQKSALAYRRRSDNDRNQNTEQGSHVYTEHNDESSYGQWETARKDRRPRKQQTRMRRLKQYRQTQVVAIDLLGRPKRAPHSLS